MTHHILLLILKLSSLVSLLLRSSNCFSMPIFDFYYLSGSTVESLAKDCCFRLSCWLVSKFVALKLELILHVFKIDNSKGQLWLLSVKRHLVARIKARILWVTPELFKFEFVVNILVGFPVLGTKFWEIIWILLRKDKWTVKCSEIHLKTLLRCVKIEKKRVDAKFTNP